MTDSEARREVLREVLGKKGVRVRPPEGGSDPAFDQKLRELPWGGEPLFLMMAAIMAAERNMGQVLSLGRTDLAFELAGREAARLARISEARGIDPDFLSIMAGYVTVCGGLGRADLRAAIEAEKHALGLPSAGDSGKVANALCEALPGFYGGAAPVQPDMIGEAFLLRAFDNYDDGGSEVVFRAFQQAKERVAAIAVRAAQHYGNEEHAPPLKWIDDLIGKSSGRFDDLALLASLLTVPSMTLASLAMKACATLFFDLHARADSGMPVPVTYFLGSLVNGVHHLMSLGKYDDARQISEECINLCREHKHLAPDLLATALMNVAVIYNRFNRVEDGCTATAEAIDILRDLTHRDPDRYRSQLGMILDNFSADLADIGKVSEGLAASKEAVRIFTDLYRQDPVANARDLAMSLNNLRSRLGQLRRFGEGLSATRRSVALLRELVCSEPDTCLFEILVALSNHAAMLRASGNPDEAAMQCNDALTLATMFGDKYRSRLRPQLAACYTELCECFGELERISEALDAADSAVELFRELEQEAPGAFGEPLSRVLTLRSICLDFSYRPAESLEACREGVAALRSAFLMNPMALATSMMSRCEYYIARSVALGFEPDAELLEPIIEELRRMSGQDETDEGR